MEMVTMSIELPKEMADHLRALADQKGLGLESMLSLWLAKLYYQGGRTDADAV